MFRLEILTISHHQPHPGDQIKLNSRIMSVHASTCSLVAYGFQWSHLTGANSPHRYCFSITRGRRYAIPHLVDYFDIALSGQTFVGTDEHACSHSSFGLCSERKLNPSTLRRLVVSH